MKSLLFVMAAAMIVLVAGSASAKRGSSPDTAGAECIDCSAAGAEMSGGESAMMRPRAAAREACKEMGGHMRRGTCVSQ